MPITPCAPTGSKALTGYFADPKVAVVQCPQAHRDWEHNAFRRMTNWEYDGFFRIGMHHRNERNAIIQHGTMTMVRRGALEATGGWSEWTICEDAELGLRLMHAGYDTIYVDEIMGRGLTPADFTAYKSQRYRWAFGAMQILKARWHWMTGRGPLTAGQRFHFLTGWFSWFADALHLAFTLLALLWTAGMIGLPEYFNLPLDLFIYPILGFFVFKAVFGLWLYRVRVPCSWKDTIAASIAAMGLQPLHRARHLSRPDQAQERIHPHRQKPPLVQAPESVRRRAGRTADVHRHPDRHLRHDDRARHQLHRRQTVDRDPVRAGDSVFFGDRERDGGVAGG